MIDMKPNSLEAERLLKHIRALCEDIGARPPGSRNERRAADYVRETLTALGVKDVREQFFTSHETMGWMVIPFLATALAGALMTGRLSKLIGGLTVLGSVLGLRDAQMAKLPFYQPLIAQSVSQNIIARIPPSDAVKRRVFFIGHLDSNKQRFMAPMPVREASKPFASLGMVLMGVTGAAMILDALVGKKKRSGLQTLTALTAVGTLAAWVYDEMQPHVEGANDNASAVAVTLGMAEQLQAQPLKNTEVILLFTGCEEVGCVGMENYLRQYAPPQQNSYFIDLEMVGTGRLCYITKHGMSHLAQYTPGARLTPIAARVAQERTELRVTGKDMLIVEEVATLRRRGYEAICIAGYDDQGFLANWHRLSDNQANIQGDTINRAARYTLALMEAIDSL